MIWDRKQQPCYTSSFRRRFSRWRMIARTMGWWMIFWYRRLRLRVGACAYRSGPAWESRWTKRNCSAIGNEDEKRSLALHSNQIRLLLAMPNSGTHPAFLATDLATPFASAAATHKHAPFKNKWTQQYVYPSPADSRRRFSSPSQQRRVAISGGQLTARRRFGQSSTRFEILCK